MTLLPNLQDHIGEYAPKIFPSLIMLFDGLKRAYEAAKDDEDSDEDSDEVKFTYQIMYRRNVTSYYSSIELLGEIKI